MPVLQFKRHISPNRKTFQVRVLLNNDLTTLVDHLVHAFIRPFLVQMKQTELLDLCTDGKLQSGRVYLVPPLPGYLVLLFGELGIMYKEVCAV